MPGGRDAGELELPGPIAWDWSEPKRIRKLTSVEDHILWAYSILTVSRQIMRCIQAGQPHPYPEGRTKAANITMSLFQRGVKSIRNLDRDDSLAQNGKRVCGHCGDRGPKFHWDHLTPQSKLDGVFIPLNQIRSCPLCNTRRGNKDLMFWYMEDASFPTLAILRRYLKLCKDYSQQKALLLEPADSAMSRGLPFVPRNLPRKFPPIEKLIWDHAYPDRFAAD